MPEKFDYTTLAYRYTARFPLLTYVGTQTNFWIIANIFLVAIMHLQSRMMSQFFSVPMSGNLGALIVVAVILGALYGAILGIAGYYMDKSIFRKKALGKVIILKSLTSLCVLILILAVLRYALFDPLILPWLPPRFNLQEESWRLMFRILLLYYSVVTLIISFINQVNKKYGPGVILPLLFGRYRDPKEEDRIFMFMDLKSSTTTAEELGHLKYSSFIRDCFSDINEVLYPYRAQVYQYVGDEIVVTWPESEGLKEHFCLRFYFACQKQFHDHADYYQSNYGLLPEFKAGVHAGKVTSVEIGEYKRDIAYHGDTLNTASRIQGVCNEYKKNFIGSKDLLDKVGSHPNLYIEDIGLVQLKGKVTKVGLVSIDWLTPAS